MKPLNILISNDDGVFAAGIRALAKSARKRGHKVKVVCPDQERSATGHGLTLQSPLRVERADELFEEGIEAWGCSGTPADCVKLALSELLKKKPDLVLSGINHGPNLGTDIFCSGTVAAAMEGTLENVPSMAISVASFKWKNYEFAGEIFIAISPANSKFFHLKLATLIAIEGTFSKVPSMAAATVPEQKISVPKFGP